MPIDPNAVAAKTEPQLFTWTDRDTLLYALGVGAGLDDLAFTTENSHDSPQQVLPTYAVIACLPFAVAAKIGTFNFAMLLHGSQAIRLFAPLPPAGKLSVVAEVADIQDKGEGKNAIVKLKATGTDPETSQVVAETLTTAVIRQEGGFGGQPGQRPVAPEIPEREPDARVALPTREDQALLYRLSGDRNPLAQRPVVRTRDGRVPEADPARAVHVWRRGPGVGRRTRWRRRHEGHGRRRAVHLSGVPWRDVDDVDLADGTRARGVPHGGVEPGRVQYPAGPRGWHRRVQLTSAAAPPWVTETARAEKVPPSRKLVTAYRSGACGSPGRRK